MQLQCVKPVNLSGTNLVVYEKTKPKIQHLPLSRKKKINSSICQSNLFYVTGLVVSGIAVTTIRN